MAVTSQQIVDFLLANPGMSDADIAAAMTLYGVSPSQVAEATGSDVAKIQERFDAVTAPEPVDEPFVTPKDKEPVAPVAPVAPAVVAETPVAGSVTTEQIVDFLTTNPNLTDNAIVKVMETYKVSPAELAKAVGLPEGTITARIAETVPNGQTITLGDTVVQPVYKVTGSGEDQQVGGIENVITYKASENKTGGDYTQYTPTGEVEKTGTQQEVKSGLKEFAIGAGLLLGLPTILNAGAAGAAGTAAGTAGLTTAELAQLDLALGGAGGTAGAASLGSALATGAPVATLTNLTGGSGAGGLLTSATPTATGGAAGVAGMGTGTGLTAGAGGLGLSTGGAGLGAAGTGAGLTAGTGLATTNALTGAGLGTALGGVTTGAGAAGTGLLTSAVKALAPTVGSLVSSGLTTGAGLLQAQTSKEAAQKAQAMIDAETAAAKKAAQFSPVGMTTRFGTSEFKVDPTTGKLTSAGYTLSPEAKAAQDRFVKLTEAGIQQAEGAQKAFEPLQTGAQSLFTLGNKYLAQSPEQVAQDYMNKQLALLQPGRELELANLQNKLQQQGRAGLSVSQGGNLGATTPELQALFNARAQQEALLAANAQQAGQQNVMFGAGLLGTGAQTMGQYYGGQQAAYSPYTTAMGQVQGLETAGQQPFTMGVNLGQIGAQAGANVGQLGLKGAGASVDLATGADATRNLTALGLGGLGSSGLLTSGINTAVQAIGQRLEDFPPLAASSNQLDPAGVYRSAISIF